MDFGIVDCKEDAIRSAASHSKTYITNDLWKMRALRCNTATIGVVHQGIKSSMKGAIPSSGAIDGAFCDPVVNRADIGSCLVA